MIWFKREIKMTINNNNQFFNYEISNKILLDLKNRLKSILKGNNLFVEHDKIKYCVNTRNEVIQSLKNEINELKEFINKNRVK